MLRDERVTVEATWAVEDGNEGPGGDVAREVADDAANELADRAAGEPVDGAAGERADGAAGERANDERSEASARDCATTGASYHEIDRQLRRLAKRRAALDSEEARWLREAEAQQIWKRLGFSTALEYLEDVFGYAPRTALERLRVAKALGRLKQLDTSLAQGELTYGAARELSRVMTPATEHAWLARARGKNLRDIEELVAGHAKGDDPDDPKDESHQPRHVSFRLSPAIDALLRQTRADLSDECGHHVEDDELFETSCPRGRTVGGRAGSAGHEQTSCPRGRTVCGRAGQRVREPRSRRGGTARVARRSYPNERRPRCGPAGACAARTRNSRRRPLTNATRICAPARR
jgi:hypothetical protein